MAPPDVARFNIHSAMAAWLNRIRALGWKRYLSETRRALVLLRGIAANGEARRRRADPGKAK